MAQVRGVFTQLYDNIDKTISAVLRDTLTELPPIYKQVFNEQTSDRKFERTMTMTPFGDVPEKGEGNVYALDLIRPGYTKDFTHLEFGLGFAVTETALEDDQYDILVRNAEWLAFSARVVEEKYAARVFNNGFTTETTSDGLSVFNTAHTLVRGGTFRNRPSAARAEANAAARRYASAIRRAEQLIHLERQNGRDCDIVRSRIVEVAIIEFPDSIHGGRIEWR